jgi:hypothetical protein
MQGTIEKGAHKDLEKPLGLPSQLEERAKKKKKKKKKKHS